MARNVSSRRSWRLRELMDEYLIVRGAEVHPGEAGHRLSGNALLLHLRRWRGDATAERTLLDISEALGGAVRPGLFGPERRSFMEQLWADMEKAFETGRLALLRMPRTVVLLRQKKVEEAWEDAPEPKSWVGILLEDEEGRVVAGQRVRIRLPDGTVRERVSDGNGRIRLEGIPAGICQVELPGIDRDEWRAA